MRATVQRVSEASVRVDEEIVSRIGTGLLVYVGCATGDSDDDVRYLATKIAALRIFTDDAGKMNRSVVDIGGDVLLVSAFTLQADARKGRRPSFDGAAVPEDAVGRCAALAEALRRAGLTVQEGVFRAHMHVHSVNDGPICILLDSTRLF
ncbi:MAG: D-tyrosyl-tRNA(Tyr) deacylase [Phycisphaerae bacterium]|nr:D-tyrosyl-tRNA(Tyr) deacylase [Phycisphaerae bacterium]